MKKYIPILLATSLLLSGCSIIGNSKTLNECEKISVKDGGIACNENEFCKVKGTPLEMYSCMDGMGDCVKPGKLLGCEKLEETVIVKNTSLKQLCETTGGKWASKHCECKNSHDSFTALSLKDSLIAGSQGIVESFDPEIGCISEKKGCETEGGNWEERNYRFQKVGIDNEKDCLLEEGLNWLTKEGYQSACMITNMKNYDDKFGGCIKNEKRYYYSDRTLKIDPDSEKADLLKEKKQECLEYSEKMFAFGQEYAAFGQEYFDSEILKNINEVFYSPKRDSCLFIVSAHYNVGDKSYTRRFLFDYLSKEKLEAESLSLCDSFSTLEARESCVNKTVASQRDFDKTVSQLKGE